MLRKFLKILPVLLLIKITCFYFFDLYCSMWRYTSVEDLLNVIKACTVSSLLIITYILFSSRFIGVPCSVFIIDFGFTVLLIAGLRLSVRFYFEHFTGDGFRVILSRFSKELFKTGKTDTTKLLIIGGGQGVIWQSASSVLIKWLRLILLFIVNWNLQQIMAIVKQNILGTGATG